MSSLSDRIAELRKRAEQVASQITTLADRRKEFAYAAAEGDAKARKAIQDADYERDALLKEQTTVADAIEIGEALEKQQQLDAAAKQERERNERAYKAARAVAALNLECDCELVRTRELLERRAALLQELAACGEREAAIAVRLQNKSGPTAAAQKAGLSRFLNMEMTPNASVRPLADTNELLLGIGAKPNGNGQPRVTPRKNGGT